MPPLLMVPLSPFAPLPGSRPAVNFLFFFFGQPNPSCARINFSLHGELFLRSSHYRIGPLSPSFFFFLLDVFRRCPSLFNGPSGENPPRPLFVQILRCILSNFSPLFSPYCERFTGHVRADICPTSARGRIYGDFCFSCSVNLSLHRGSYFL